MVHMELLLAITGISKKCVIYHHVTLAGEGCMGDNCLLGAGAKVPGELGDNVK